MILQVPGAGVSATTGMSPTRRIIWLPAIATKRVSVKTRLTQTTSMAAGTTLTGSPMESYIAKTGALIVRNYLSFIILVEYRRVLYRFGRQKTVSERQRQRQ
jgi:hypothetical protein